MSRALSAQEALGAARRGLEAHLDTLEAVSAEHGVPLRDVAAVRERLTAIELRVVVVGEINRGKSTFMNALMGRKVFPARASVCTAVLTELRDGLPSARVRHKGSYVFVDVPLSEEPVEALRELVSKKNPAADSIEVVQLTFENRFACDGVVLVDTPGVNDPVTWREELTRRAVASADAAILLLDPHTPLTMSERTFLAETIHAAVADRIVFVVNKADDLSESDLAVALGRLREKLAEIVSRPVILPLSARNALRAREAGLVDDPSERVFRGAEEHIDHFLREERLEMALAPRRAAVHDLATGMLRELRLRLGALTQEREALARKVETAWRRLDEEAARLDREGRDRLARLKVAAARAVDRAPAAWDGAAQDALCSSGAARDVVARSEGDPDQAQALIRERLALTRSAAQRELQADMDRLLDALAEESRTALRQLGAAVERIEIAVVGDEATPNLFLSFADGALAVANEAFSRREAKATFEGELVRGAVGVVAGLLGMLSGLVGVVVGALAGNGIDTRLVAVTGALSRAERDGRTAFHGEVRAQVDRVVARSVAKLEARTAGLISDARARNERLMRDFGSEQGTIEERRAELERAAAKVESVLRRLT